MTSKSLRCLAETLIHPKSPVSHALVSLADTPASTRRRELKAVVGEHGVDSKLVAAVPPHPRRCHRAVGSWTVSSRVGGETRERKTLVFPIKTFVGAKPG
jgi:hypothetical protein